MTKIATPVLALTQRIASRYHLAAGKQAQQAPKAEDIADVIQGALEPDLIAAELGVSPSGADISVRGNVVTLKLAGEEFVITVRRK